jgi:hypothetical protein
MCVILTNIRNLKSYSKHIQMKKTATIIFLLISIQSFTQVHTSYLWHMHQPTYWGEVSQSNPNRYQLVKESQDLKINGTNTYADGLAHPLNNLEEIFGLPDRVNAYQFQLRMLFKVLWDILKPVLK